MVVVAWPFSMEGIMFVLASHAVSAYISASDSAIANTPSFLFSTPLRVPFPASIADNACASLGKAHLHCLVKGA
jgi:hypothetical protein